MVTKGHVDRAKDVAVKIAGYFWDTYEVGRLIGAKNSCAKNCLKKNSDKSERPMEYLSMTRCKHGFTSEHVR